MSDYNYFDYPTNHYEEYKYNLYLRKHKNKQNKVHPHETLNVKRLTRQRTCLCVKSILLSSMILPR